MKRTTAIFLSLSSGLLLAAGWPAQGYPILLLIALLPLFYLEQQYFEQQDQKKKYHMFFYPVLAFVVWNAFTTYWVSNSTLLGGIFAVVLNAILMAIVFYIYHLTRIITQNKSGQFIFGFYWIAWEFFHLDWDLSWPWLNLGNGFSAYPSLIQWYEYTGSLGGSAWIIIVNILIFRLAYSIFFTTTLAKEKYLNLITTLFFIGFPIIFSLITYNNYEEDENPIGVVVVQPNNDPYTEQYTRSSEQVLNHIFELADSVIDSSTQFIVCPESAIQERPLYENFIHRGQSIRILTNHILKHRDRAIIIGASTYYIFDDDEELPLSARPFPDAQKYYNAYNTAIYIDGTTEMQMYHKSKLTPGVEKMPFKSLFKHIEKFAIDMGGTVGTLGTDPERIPYHTTSGLKIAPIICYESIYGEFCSRFVRNGAQALFIITNDGWWGNTAGHRQHLQFASLRAIETRRSVARSANTGISAIINQRGDIVKATNYWEEDAINATININNKITFYVKYGDYIGRTAIFGSIMLLLITISAGLIKRKSLR